jgi:hypothetical protein
VLIGIGIGIGIAIRAIDEAFDDGPVFDTDPDPDPDSDPDWGRARSCSTEKT